MPLNPPLHSSLAAHTAGLADAALVVVRGDRALQVQVLAPAGTPSGTTVFLVHGAGGRAAQWRWVIPGLLAAGHQVVAFDALGHGASPAPRQWRSYAGSAFVADLQAIVEHHRAPVNVLVGHSYGTRVVLGALSQGLAGISRAVLLAPPAPAWPRRAPWLAYLPVPVLAHLRPRLSAGFRAAAWGPDAPVDLVDEETAISDRNPLYVFKALWRQALQLEPAALGALSLPVQVLAGEADRLTPPAGAQLLAQALPNARLTVLPRAGHQLPLEAPAAVVQAVLNGGP